MCDGMLRDEDAEQLLRQFPKVEFAFAYGSGAIEQAEYSYDALQAAEKQPMLDLVLVVEDAVQWHAENMHRNPHHYTSLIPVSPSVAAFIQEAIPAHFWFNAYVPMLPSSSASSSGDVRRMKYGVISSRHIVDDLQRWTDLYAAGRLHKPVRILKPNKIIEEAMQQNLDSAIRTSLLLLPAEFSELELYLAMASLSYVGDPRMIIGENPKKVVNLVTPILPHYRHLCSSAMNRVAPEVTLQQEKIKNSTSSLTIKMQQDISPRARWQLLNGLPHTLKTMLPITKQKEFTKKAPNTAAIRAALASIVARSSSLQTLKGVFTVGLLKGGVYFAAKIRKRFSVSPFAQS